MLCRETSSEHVGENDRRYWEGSSIIPIPKSKARRADEKEAQEGQPLLLFVAVGGI